MNISSKRTLIYVLSIIILVVWGIAFYFMGYVNLQTQIRDDYRTMFEVADEEKDAMGTIDHIRSIMMQANLANQTANDLKQALIEKENDIAELREQIYFYRAIIAPEDIAKGLTILSAKLGRPVEDGRFPFEIILRKSNPQEKMIKGSLNLILKDTLDTSGKSLVMKQFYTGDTKFKFKYFQRLKGMIKVPNSFIPVTIEARILAGNSQKLEKIWYWGDLLGGEHAYQ